MNRAVAIIPARGGSKGIPAKNIKPFLGIPLVAHSIKAALAAQTVSDVFVSSDDDKILKIAKKYGAQAVKRPADISGDTASSETALLHAIANVEICRHADTIVFLQCTSPLTVADEIDQVVRALNTSGADTAFSVVENHAFLWRVTDDGSGIGVNHDISQPRQRRQDKLPEYRETGAIYALKRRPFEIAGQRFFGRNVPVPLKNVVELELDTPRDWLALEAYGRLRV
ncbi:MAG: acylneuraminate cytidylyltransferase family protein [Roseibium sp.]